MNCCLPCVMRKKQNCEASNLIRVLGTWSTFQQNKIPNEVLEKEGLNLTKTPAGKERGGLGSWETPPEDPIEWRWGDLDHT